MKLTDCNTDRPYSKLNKTNLINETAKNNCCGNKHMTNLTLNLYFTMSLSKTIDKPNQSRGRLFTILLFLFRH